MIHTDIPLWTRIFGSGWDTLMQYCPDIGGFLIDHENKKVYADSNAVSLANLPAEPDYSDTVLLVAKLMEQDRGYGAVSVRICEYSDSVTAGFFMTERTVSAGKMVFPVCTEARLMGAMSEYKGKSLLALIQLEDKASSSLSDFHVYSALSAIKSAVPVNALISAYSKERYWLFVPDMDIVCSSGGATLTDDDIVGYLGHLQQVVRDCVLLDEMGEPIGTHGLTFTAGCGADGVSAQRRMHTAEFALFEATGKGRESVCTYSVERYEHQKGEYGCMKRFSQLIEENLFVYHFQPIVSAETGDILAYEALMRTDESIGMFPLEILGAATRYGRLYDIEKATFYNTLEFISENQNVFTDKKLFVNSITAHMLTDADWQSLESRYGELLEKVVVELTEQTEVDDESLGLIHSRLRRCNMTLAIDDYGTGYSNTSNLLRYSPNYVKIDRSLITDIHTKPNMQKLVASIIDFVHANGYQALAEGVETGDELRCMIQLGSDLIQGYYVSRPKPVIINEVSEGIRQEIIRINEECSMDIARVYRASDGETIAVSELTKNHYSTVQTGTGSVTLDGSNAGEVQSRIFVTDGAAARLILKNLTLSTSTGSDPLISIGEGASAEIYITGENALLGSGIYVPRTASVTFKGDGILRIMNEAADAYCIGVGRNNSPGNICFDSDGTYDLTANGDTTVGIGGGRNEGGLAIIMKGGQYNIHCSGSRCIGIGITEGGSVIDMSKVSVTVDASAPDAVGIGSAYGSTDISMTDYMASFNLSGVNLCGVGSVSGGRGDIELSDGTLNMEIHGRSINCVGTRKGSVNCRTVNSTFNFDCEGNSISGIGDMRGDGDVTMYSSEVNIAFRTKEGFGLGSRDGMLTVDRVVKNININE